MGSPVPARDRESPGSEVVPSASNRPDGTTTQKHDLLIMTAALSVVREGHAMSNRRMRLLQYLHGLLLWPTTSIKDIVFCENSGLGYCLDGLVEMAKERGTRIEVLRFCDSTVTENYGLLEHRIMKYAVENSMLIRDHSSFYKVTGRLFVENFDEVAHEHRNDTNVFSVRADGVWATFFKLSCDDFRAGLYHNDADFECDKVEHILPRRISKFCAFRRRPTIVGRAGWSGLIYDKDYYLPAMMQAQGLVTSVLS